MFNSSSKYYTELQVNILFLLDTIYDCYLDSLNIIVRLPILFFCYYNYHILCFYFILTISGLNKLFHLQLDVTSSQLLVTDAFFSNEAFRKQLSDTVNSLLALRVIPIFNENDAVSTRSAPYEACNSFIFAYILYWFILLVSLFTLLNIICRF